MGHITLYHGSGAQDFELFGDSLEPDELRRLLLNARRLLSARGQNQAIALLESGPFEIVSATNHFNDDFHVLVAQVPLIEYEEYRKARLEWGAPARQLAKVISEAGGPYIRFVVMELALADPDCWEVFLCHASEDKKAIAKPLYEHLESRGIKCWFDEAEVAWGDSIVSLIQEGLSRARFVIVVLSRAFLDKGWPQKELRTALSLEIEGGQTSVLPLLAEKPEKLLSSLPFLREKRYLVWSGDPTSVEKELRVLLRREQQRRTTGD